MEARWPSVTAMILKRAGNNRADAEAHHGGRPSTTEKNRTGTKHQPASTACGGKKPPGLEPRPVPRKLPEHVVCDGAAEPRGIAIGRYFS